MILVAGSANLDFVVRANHIPLPGETVLGTAFQTFPGGKGANQAVACARAGGVATHMLAAFGADPYAQPLKASLQGAGVVVHEVLPPDLPTGVAFICVSQGGENAITVAPGANKALQPKHLPPLTGFRYLLMQLETPLATVTAYAQAARAAGVTVVLNAAPAQTLPPELLQALDVLIVNQGELESLAPGGGGIAQCLTRLPVPTVVVTLGARGCCAHSAGQFYWQPAFAIEPVDTTGAGDTFCGALVAARSQGADWALALQRASAAGALACTRPGAQSSIPSDAEVSAFLASQAPACAHALQALQAYCSL